MRRAPSGWVWPRSLTWRWYTAILRPRDPRFRSPNPSTVAGCRTGGVASVNARFWTPSGEPRFRRPKVKRLAERISGVVPVGQPGVRAKIASCGLGSACQVGRPRFFARICVVTMFAGVVGASVTGSVVRGRGRLTDRTSTTAFGLLDPPGYEAPHWICAGRDLQGFMILAEAESGYIWPPSWTVC